MTTTTQLRKIINNTNEKVLSRKLNKYFSRVDKLEELKDLVREMLKLTGNYNHYEAKTAYDNNKSFWDNNFSLPSEALEAKTENYSLNDKYLSVSSSEKYAILVKSFSSLSEFYNNSVIKELSEQISKDLKNDTTELIDSMDSDIQDLLLKIFK